MVSSLQPPDNAIGFEDTKNASKIGLQCDCMPGCNEIVNTKQTAFNSFLKWKVNNFFCVFGKRYDVDITTSDYNYANKSKQLKK